MTLQEVQSERQHLAAEQTQLQLQLSATSEERERLRLKARLKELQNRLTLLSVMHRQLVGDTSAPPLPEPLRGALAKLESAESALKRESAKRRALEEEVMRLRAHASRSAEEKDALVARVHAGMARRELMLHVLHAFLTCEDDTSLDEDAYDARMAQVERDARTLVSLERTARLAIEREA